MNGAAPTLGEMVRAGATTPPWVPPRWLNRIARHPAIRLAFIMQQTDADIQEKLNNPGNQATLALLNHPAAQQIFADNHLLYGQQTGLAGLASLFTPGKYGLQFEADELLPGLSDTLSIAAGYPVDAGTLTPDEALAILQGYAARTAATSAVTAGNTRVTAREEDEAPDPCEIGPYSAMSRKCGARGGQAHHIVPDFTLRTGPRPAVYGYDPSRINPAPSLAQGMAICLTGHARPTDQNGEHYAAHQSTDRAIARAGMANRALPGTATWEDIRDASLEGIRAAKPDCLPAATAAIDAQFAGMPADQALRAAMDYRALPQRTRDLLQAGHRL